MTFCHFNIQINDDFFHRHSTKLCMRFNWNVRVCYAYWLLTSYQASAFVNDDVVVGLRLAMLRYVIIRIVSNDWNIYKCCVYCTKFESRYVHWFGLMRLYIMHVICSFRYLVLKRYWERALTIERIYEQMSQNHHHFMKLYCIECIETFCQNAQNILTQKIVCNQKSLHFFIRSLSVLNWHLASLGWNRHQMKLNRLSDIHRIILV